MLHHTLAAFNEIRVASLKSKYAVQSWTVRRPGLTYPIQPPNEKGLKIIIGDMFGVWGSVAVLFDPVKGLKTWQTVTASRCSVGQP
jgi:hypothetical protein